VLADNHYRTIGRCRCNVRLIATHRKADGLAAKRDILALLRSAGGDLPDHAIAEALPTADPAARDRAVDILLQRGQLPGLIGLVRYYDGFTAEQQQRILDKLADLEPALRSVAGSADRQGRTNVVTIIGRTGAVQLSYLLAQMLRVSDSRLTRSAATELLRMARRSIPAAYDTAPESRRRHAFVLNAVIDACACFHQHRRRDVLLASLCFVPHVDPRLVHHTLNRKAAAFPALGEAIAQADHPISCRALLPLAGVEGMLEPVVRGLAQGRAGENLGLVLRFAHLVAAPPVRFAVRHVRRADHLLPTHARFDRMDTATTRRVPRWITTLSIDPELRVQGLAMAAAHADALTRLASLRELIAERGGEADDFIATLCFDHEAAIARLALRHLIRRRWRGLGRLIVRLMASDHESIRRMAERQLGPVGFNRYWVNWDAMSPATRLTAGRALMKIDPSFNRNLDRKLAAASADDRLQAIMMVRHLQQSDYHEEALLDLSHDRDSRVASAAVGALGKLGDSERAVRAVQDALRHRDDRVRANAVESLQQMKRTAQVQQELGQIASGPGNRSRATAIRALMQLPTAEAVEHLERMLADDDESHRISALWVVERMGLATLIESVAKLATHDNDAKVRRRAGRVVRDIARTQVSRSAEAG